jgi:branched-chain amino acid aminotransferase
VDFLPPRRLAAVPPLPAAAELQFGRQIAPYIFSADFRDGDWQELRIVPYDPSNSACDPTDRELTDLGLQVVRRCLPRFGNSRVTPEQVRQQIGPELLALVGTLAQRQLPDAALCFQYGQGAFDGLKAFRQPGWADISLFRPRDNATRFAESCQRQLMPAPDPDFFLKACEEVVRANQSCGWFPNQPGFVLYLRPLLRPVDQSIGLQAGATFHFRILATPVVESGVERVQPLKALVELNAMRVAPGGLGGVKAVSNYANLAPVMAARVAGYDQVIWLDRHGNLSEGSSTNLFFVVWDGKQAVVRTPPLNRDMLPGITRDSALQLLRAAEIAVTDQYVIALRTLQDWLAGSRLLEAFVTGTAAGVSPLGELRIGDQVTVINEGKPGPVASWLAEEFAAVQAGQRPASSGWIHTISM